MLVLMRITCLIVFVFISQIVLAQDNPVNQDAANPVQPTSATDHKVRIEKVKRVNPNEAETEHPSKSLKKRKAPGGKGSVKEARVYKKHRHFASRDIRLRSKSKTTRKENLGVGTE